MIEVGLCRSCKNHRVVRSRRGPKYYLCELAASDPRFPKYPPLPVVECEGYVPGGEDPWEQLQREEGSE